MSVFDHRITENDEFLTVMSVNIEGFSNTKKQLISNICYENKCGIVCIQETHRNETNIRPSIPGMSLIIESPHSKHGNVIFAKNEILHDLISSAKTVIN